MTKIESIQEWQVKSLGYEAAFPLDISQFEAKTGNSYIDKSYWFNVDQALKEYEFHLPKGFHLDGVCRGAYIFIQVSCSHKPTLKQLKKIKEIILTGLQSAHEEYLAEFINSWNEK